MHPNRRASAHQQKRVHRRVMNGDAYEFFNLLTGPDLLDQVEAQLPEHRERLFPPTETLSMFLAQALSADRSCQQAVNEAAIKRLTQGMAVCSTHTGAYCRARQRLPVEMVRRLARHTGRLIAQRSLAAWHWRGRAVRLVDGTTVSMPDTPANQSAYPQSPTQKPGLGFPLCRLVGILCLGSGVLLNAALGRYQGKVNRFMLEYQPYRPFPYFRGISRSLVHCSILSRNGASGKVGAVHYQRRWNVELDLRNIKTTLGLETLSCKTPLMAEKEVWVYLLAYNLIRLIMAQAAVLVDRLPRELSFKHTLQLWVTWSRCNTATDCDDKLAVLFVLIAQQKMGNRPGRIEPRAVKRRPKQYPLLTKPRQLATHIIRTLGHPKKLK